MTIQLTAARIAHGGSVNVADLPGARQSLVQRDRADLASAEVATAFDLSYKALEPRHQRFLRLLGLSPTPQISPEAAAALTGSTFATAQDALAVLADRRLLAQASAGQYRFHDLIRGFAAMRCAEDEPAPSAGKPSAGYSTTTSLVPTRPTACCTPSGAGSQ